jgi:hypothetical protein
MHATFPSDIPGGMIVLEGFVGNLFRYEPGSDQEVNERYKPTSGSDVERT